MMKKNLLLLMSFMLFAGLPALADNAPEWRNPQINQQNREARRANFFAYENEETARVGKKQASSRYLSMEGMWRFCFVKNHQDAPQGFWTTKYDDFALLILNQQCYKYFE